MQNIRLGDGRVTFTVENEFTVTLTLVGDDESMPWRLLDIKILLEDEEIDIGERKPLIHPSQIHFIHSLAQSRLFSDSEPLVDLYSCVHFFCLSLQLEILYSQALQLKQEKWADNIIVSEYNAANSLVLQYWREAACRVTIKMDLSGAAGSGLHVLHSPAMKHASDELNTPDHVAANCGRLSVESLMNSVLYSRAKDRVLTLKERLERGCPGIIVQFAEERPSSLALSWRAPWDEMQGIEIKIDWNSGRFQPLLDDRQYTTCNAKTKVDLTHLEESLNSPDKDPALLALPLLNELRCRLALLHHEMLASHLPVVISSSLPISNAQTHSLSTLSPFKLFLQLKNDRSHCIVVEVQLPRDESFSSHVVQRAFFLQLKPCRLSFDRLLVRDDADDAWNKNSFLHADLMLPIDLRRWKWTQETTATSTLPSLVAYISESVPFLELSEDLSRNEVRHCGVELEASFTVVLKVICLPLPVSAFGKRVVSELNRSMLDCSFRVDKSQSESGHWLVEILIGNLPLEIEGNTDSFRRLFFSYTSDPSVASQLLSDWKGIARLYGPVLELSAYMNDKQSKLSKMVTVLSYDYRKIVLSYGPEKQFTVSLSWNKVSAGFQLAFSSRAMQPNPHAQITDHLLTVFNQTKCIPLLMKGLHHTLVPFAALESLNYCPKAMIGVKEGNNMPYKPFSVFFSSPSRFRVVFRGLYAIEVFCQTDDVVLIRDAAYSQVDATQVLKGLATIPCFKHFLHGFSERCRLQESVVVSSSGGGLQSPVQSAPPIVTPSATTKPFFPTLPAATRSSASTAPSSPRHVDNLNPPPPLPPPSSSSLPSMGGSADEMTEMAVEAKPPTSIAQGTVERLPADGVDNTELNRHPAQETSEGNEEIPERDFDDDQKASDNPFSVESVGATQPTSVGGLSAFSPSLFTMTSPGDVVGVNPSPSMYGGGGGGGGVGGSDALIDYVNLSAPSPNFLLHDPGHGAGGVGGVGGAGQSLGMFGMSLKSPSPEPFMGLVGTPSTPQDMIFGGMDFMQTSHDVVDPSYQMTTEMEPASIPQQQHLPPPPHPQTTLSSQGFASSSAAPVDEFGGGGGGGAGGEASGKSPEDLLGGLPSIKTDPNDDDDKVLVLTSIPSLPPFPKPQSPPLVRPLSQQPTIFTPPSHFAASPHSPSQQATTVSAAAPDSLVFPSSLQAYLSQQMQTEGWAAACPALIHQTVFYSLLSPEPFGQPDRRPLKHPFQSFVAGALFFSDDLRVCPLEHYLGSVFLLHHLTQRINRLGVQVDAVATHGNSVAFRVGSLRCVVELNTSSSVDFLKFDVAVVETSDVVIDQAAMKCLQSFFRSKVACPPYSTEALTAFVRLLAAPARILRDCISIMDMETERPSGSRWDVKLCLTIPPNCKGQASAGIKTGAAAVVCKSRLLLFIQLASVKNYDLAPTTLPILCTLASNEVSVLDKLLQVSGTTSPGATTVAMAKELIAGYSATNQQRLQGSVLFPMVKELITNLPLPS
ncbi:mediator of RNA polymerase II transcription subunit 14-like isoform X2 [Oscarella lobularis]